VEIPIDVSEHHDECEAAHPLLAAGWRQGVIFDAPGTSYDLNILSSDGTLERGRPRAIRAGERLVLISHACDIKADDEKYVEALICRKHDPTKEILGRWDQNSPRYFIVDPRAAYVADASHRVKVSKDALLSLTRDEYDMDELRLYRFIEWLTRRYDRPTIPDSVYQRFHARVYAALRGIAEEKPEVWENFNVATNDVRVWLPDEVHPPYTIGIVYATGSGLTEEQTEAIHEVHRIIVDAVGQEVILRGPPVIIELDELTFGVLRRTQPLIIEHLSWVDDEAAPPPWLLEHQSD
jgi:hypothetical protein